MTTDSDTRNKMRAGVRRRGTRGKWAYTVNLGLAPAQRCVACGHREWLGHKRLEACPACDGALRDTCERRQEQKGGFATRAEAVRARTRALHELGDGAHVLRSDVTLRQFLQDEWLPGIEGQIKESTLRSYTQHVQDHIAPRLGDHQLQRLTAREIQKVYAVMAKGGRADGGKGALSPATVRRVHATLHRALRDAVRWGIVTHNAADNVELPRAEHHERVVWGSEQLRAFLASVAQDRLAPLWTCYAMSGARRGELLGLRWSDIDTAGGALTIRRSRTKVAGEALESDPKTERSRRTIALDAGTMHVLERQKRLQEQEQALLGTRRVEQGYVFAAENGEPFDPDQVTALFAAAVRRSSLPVIRLHDLRHVHATIMLTEQRQALTQVSRRLGHSTTITTANVYAHALAELDRKLADDFGASVLPEQSPESGQ